MRTENLLRKSLIKTTAKKTGPWLDAFNAYHVAYCPWPTQSVDSTLPAPVQAIPAGQRSLWEGVARSAANVKLDPDLYVWRLTLDVSRFRYAADLRGAAAEKEARSTTDHMLSEAANGAMSFQNQARELDSLVRCYGMSGALFDGGSPWGLEEDSPATLDAVFRWNMCFIAPLIPAEPADGGGLLQSFFAAIRWLADEDNNSRFEWYLRRTACVKLWAHRDIYSTCGWLQPPLIQMARKIFRHCCLELPRQEKAPMTPEPG